MRSESDRIRTYCHIGTGNYNSKTARLYTDLGLLTCRPELGRDLVNLFHFLTGYAPEQRYEQVLVAPDYMRTRFEELIEREMANQQASGNGRIIAKMNGLDDKRMMRKLYEASQAGVSDRPDHPRPLHAAPRPARLQREHPRDQHPGPLPGA